MASLLTTIRIIRAALSGIAADEIIERERAHREAAARALCTPAEIEEALRTLDQFCAKTGAGWVAREFGIDGRLDHAMAVVRAAVYLPRAEGRQEC
jgi:hypothetical protein